MRQELKLQRYRGLVRPSIQGIPNKPSVPLKPLPEPEHVPDWLVQEDWMILQVLCKLSCIILFIQVDLFMALIYNNMKISLNWLTYLSLKSRQTLTYFSKFVYHSIEYIKKVSSFNSAFFS